MEKIIGFGDDFLNDNKARTDVANSCVSGQFNLWLRIGVIMEGNPNLPFKFIRETLVSHDEIKKAVRYVRKTTRSVY